MRSKRPAAEMPPVLYSEEGNQADLIREGE